ncbi:MAG: CpsD/CapB family tyrosine-protein kinase [Sporomusaceae bacterium]|nr:CpsD/CapB family tyrosine-protein kinase [Sporomusaceae bacterium]
MTSRRSAQRLIVHEQSKSPIVEAYRTLRTKILYSKNYGELKSILFTSTGSAEGKSTTIANMAVVLAQAGKKVILMDCDLRKPVQHLIFGKKNRGLTNILAEEGSPQELLQDTEIKNLKILTSGPNPLNPSELLGCEKMRELFDYLKTQADYLIIDAPPVIAVTDACVLASQVDGIFLVVNSGTIRREMAQKARDLLIEASGRVLGVILNRVEIEGEDDYYYYGSDRSEIGK